MLHALMLPSGNDAAMAIAEWAGKRIRRFTNIINMYRLFPKKYKF
jgi:D-alanyl-D-alanine carboxypeptidase